MAPPVRFRNKPGESKTPGPRVHLHAHPQRYDDWHSSNWTGKNIITTNNIYFIFTQLCGVIRHLVSTSSHAVILALMNTDIT